MTSVVCVVDGTSASLRAARVAVQLAEALDARLRLADPVSHLQSICEDGYADVLVMAEPRAGSASSPPARPAADPGGRSP